LLASTVPDSRDPRDAGGVAQPVVNPKGSKTNINTKNLRKQVIIFAF
jgi:hypothetical protein